MIITKTHQESMLSSYSENHTIDESSGFVDGMNAMFELINKNYSKSSEHYPSQQNYIMKQLKLTRQELDQIGFYKAMSIGDEMNPSREYYKIDTLNGFFYYNPDESENVWYHQTIIGDRSNHVHLNIHKKPQLFTLLQCFRVKINKIV
jgi:hypothetical protein